MKIKSTLAKPFANYISRKIKSDSLNAIKFQDQLFTALVKRASKTSFGKDHQFDLIKSYEEFKLRVPLRDYEGLLPYINELKLGKQNILWPGKPAYFAKSSGTTSGVKYLPITKESIPNHINTARNSLLCFIHETGLGSLTDGKMIFLSGSPELERIGGIPTGRLSGIVNHHIPYYLRRNQLPSYTTNCIEDWEEKLNQIVEETIDQDMTLISGIPPWTQMYFDELMKRSGKKVGELFPNLKLLVHGGVNFEPYKEKLLQSIGRPIAMIETYPASEGFIAFQDSQTEPGLLLNINAGIFYEFVLATDIFKENPLRISLAEVQLGVNYAIILNTNAGLFGYKIGDTVKFVSLNPYRIIVTGRTKHFISAFGEHVIGEEVEQALMVCLTNYQTSIVEFTVAPQINPIDTELPYHEWFIEFEVIPANLNALAQEVDEKMRQLNIYYNDLRTGNILQALRITPIQKNGFINYMKSIGKLGGQNKVPRLSNDRVLANELKDFYQ